MPRAFVLPLLLALAPLAPAQETLRIEGLQGRVETLGSAQRVELLTGLGPRDCSGPGLLEAGSMASARLFWPTRASLITQGRAGLEWRSGSEVFLRVFELQHGELEVRRGPLALELPWNWNASFGTGAYRLRSLPGGALEIETVAGAAPQLWWSRGGLIRPFGGPACGERVLLPPGWSPKIQGAQETYAPWSRVHWPWTAAPEALRVTVEPEVKPAERVPAQVAGVPPVEAQAETPLLIETPFETPQAPEQPVPAPPHLPPFDPQLWHGLARDELELVGALAIERRDDLVLERTEHDGITLRLRSDATRSAWVLRESTDLELAPGTLVLLDERGVLLANLGAIRSHARPKDRPAVLEAGIALRP